MTSDPYKSSESDPEPGQDLVRSMQRVGDHLLAGMDEDSRVQSGVPNGHLSGDLDFIQMTGLARPSSISDGEGEVPFANGRDASGPLSFYEKGVADVDTALSPRPQAGAGDMVPSIGSGVREPHVSHDKYSIDELKQIINELSQPGAAGMDRPITEVDGVLDAGGSGVTHEAAHDFSMAEPPGIQSESGETGQGAGAEPPEPPQTVLVSKTDSLSELLRRELASQTEDSSIGAEGTQTDGDAATDTPDMSPILESVYESPEMPSLEPVPRANELEPLGELSGVLDEFISERDTDVTEPHPVSSPELVDSENPASSDPDASKPFSHDLAEVERLLKTLQEQPRDTLPADSAIVPAPSGAPAASREEQDEGESATAIPVEMFGKEKDESVYRRPQDRRRKRTSRTRGRVRRRLVRLAVAGVFLAIVVATAWSLYRWSERGLATPESMLARAATLVSKGNYSEAAAEYGDFAARNPNHDARPDAQFNAAFYLQVMPSDEASANASETGAARLEQSLKQFQQFVEDNPLHAKAARAKTVMGLLQYRLRRYKEAIDQLQNPSLRVEDPNASLVILRTLASSYARLGDFESARSAYLQAASLPDNYSPDVDYKELSDLCKSMADQASTPDEKRRYLQLYSEQLSHAILTPGIDPVSKKRMQNLLATQQPASEGAPEGTGAAPAAKSDLGPEAPAGGTPPSGAPDAGQASPAPVAPSTLNAEPDARLEAQQLGAGAMTPNSAESRAKDSP